MTLIGVAAKSLARNKVRTALTVLGVAVAMLTFILLRTMIYAWASAADYAAKDRVVTRHKVTFIMPLPLNYMRTLRDSNLVKETTFATWFGGKDPKHDQEFFGSLAVETDTYFKVMSEMAVPDAEMAAWKEDRSGAIVGDVLAKKLGWKVGDKVTLETGIYPAEEDKPWAFTIRGIYTTTAKSVDRSSFLFHYAMLNEALPADRKDSIGWVMSRVSDPSRAAEIGTQIDKLFDEKDIQTLSQDERSFQASFLAGVSAVLDAVNIVSVVILVIMMLVLGNTIAMGVRERTNEYGTMRAIGFLPSHITTLIVGESVITALVGGALGIGLSIPFVEKGLGAYLEENMGALFPYFRVPTQTLLAAVAIAFFLGLFAAIFPALGASRLKVTEALRRVA